MQPWRMIFIGFVLSLMGVALPLLMLIHVVELTFFLNFFSFFSSVTGLILGIFGAASYVQRRRK